MTRKTMADRYAAQRSRKDNRRRSLPRLSDAAPLAVQEREFDETNESLVDSGTAAADMPGDSVTAARRSQRTALPRRAPSARGIGGLPQTPTFAHVDYHYVLRDLRRIAITAVTMLVLLIVLNIVVQNLIH